MSEFFDNFLRMFEAIGPAPVQYGRNGVTCGDGVDRGCSPDAATGKAPGLEVSPGASGVDQEAIDRETMRKDWEWSVYRRCAREDAQEGETALGSLAGRAQAVNSDWTPEFSYICKDCGGTFSASGPLSVCELCADPDILCPECLGFHMEAGHVSDAENAREMERSR